MLAKSGAQLTAAIIKAVIKQAAFSIGVQVAIVLLFAPLIGQAFAGLYAVAQAIGGKYYEKQMKKVIGQTMSDIQDRAASAQKRAEAAANKVYEEESPAAQALAMSNEPLGDFWSNAVKKTTNFVTKKLPAQAIKILRDPKAQTKLLVDISSFGFRPLAKVVMTGAASAAKAIESTGMIKEGTLSKPITEAREVTDDVLYSAEKVVSPFTAVQEGTGLAFKYGGEGIALTMEATGNEKGAEYVRGGAKVGHAMAQESMTALSPTGMYDLSTGREGYKSAEAACAKMRSQAFAAIDKEAALSIAKLRSPEGRSAMRKAIAQALRDDPVFIARKKELQALEEQQRQWLLDQQNKLENIVGPVQPSSSGAGTAVGVAAAAAAAFFLAR